MSADYDAAIHQAVFFDLGHPGLLEVEGPEAVAFLHNVCTNDIKNLPVHRGCEAFLTTHKAKTLAYFVVSRFSSEQGDLLRLDMISESAAKVAQILDRYLISEQCAIADRSSDAVLVRLAGPEAEAILQKALGGAIPSGPPLSIVPLEQVTGFVRSCPLLGVPALDVFTTPAAAVELCSMLTSAGVPRAGMDVHEVLRVEAGTPLHGIDCDEDRFVVEIGRTRQAISYTKGCYLGQEPIVMARDRGQVNRTFLGVRAEEGAAFSRGSKLQNNGLDVGVVTSSVVSPRFGVLGLAYLKRGFWEPGTRLQTDDGREVEVSALPFGAG